MSIFSVDSSFQFKPYLFIYAYVFISYQFALGQSHDNKTPTDTASLFYIAEIKIIGNYITKEKTITRELSFKENEIISNQNLDLKLEESERNLNRTSLFNFVDIEYSLLHENHIQVRIIVTERWYFWPDFYLNHTERNFSEWWRTKDLSKLEYGIGVRMNNFRGRKEKIQFSYHSGFFHRFSINYHGFYIDKERKHSISAIVNLFTQNSIPYGTQNNKQVWVKTEDEVMDNKVISLIYSYRPQVKTLHNFTFSYEYNAISDTVAFLNPEFLGIQNREVRFFSLNYSFSYDTRDSRIYPTKGTFFGLSFKQFGLGILEHETFSTNIFSKIVVHNQISKAFYTSFGLGLSYSYTNNYRFFPYHGLGYGEFIRGYEHYVIDGQFATIAKSMIRYQLLSDKIIHLNFWPIRKLHQFNKIPIAIYTNIFFDCGYVSDKTQYNIINNNTLVNKIVFGYGVGIDFVTYYDKVFRLDYSFNEFGEHGIFIHWKIGIK